MYVPYQSFDEFSMTEIGAETLSEPHLFIRRTNDTIKIVRTDNTKDTMVYINKGNYWYSSIRVRLDYTFWSKLWNLVTPNTPTYGYDPKQIDVYRYIRKDQIVEAWFYDLDEKKQSGIVGMMDDHICVFTRQAPTTHLARFYAFDQAIDEALDSAIFDSTIMGKYYKNFKHKETYHAGQELYEYDSLENQLLWINTYSKDSSLNWTDTIPLNALGIYHVPAFGFSFQDGQCISSTETDGMLRMKISCTTLETDGEKQ